PRRRKIALPPPGLLGPDIPESASMDLHLDGKNVLITGGSKGIGRAAAEVLAGEGCNLVLVARTQKDLDTAKAALLAKFNTRVETVAADLSESRNVDRLAREFPDIDILVNNAGAIPGGNLIEIDEAKWRAAWDLKVFGYVNMCRAYYARMKARKSRSEEHTSEFQSRGHLVCRLLLEKKKKFNKRESIEKTTQR